MKVDRRRLATIILTALVLAVLIGVRWSDGDIVSKSIDFVVTFVIALVAGVGLALLLGRNSDSSRDS